MKNLKGKILALCLSVLMVVALFTPVIGVSADSAVVVSVDDTTVNLAEESFKVSVSIANNTGFSTGNVRLTYDNETFAFVSAEAASTDVEILAGNTTPGTIDLEVDSASSGNYSGNGAIAYLTFGFVDGATAGEYEITAEELNSGFGNIDEQLLTVEYETGALVVHSGYHFVETTPASYTEAGEKTAYCDTCNKELGITETIPTLTNAVYTVANTPVASDGTVSTVAVDVNISDNDGFYVSKFTVNAPGLTLTSVEPANEDLEAYYGDALVISSASYADYEGNGKVATINFTIDNPAESGVYTVTLTTVDAANWDEMSLAPTTVAGTVTVTVTEPEPAYPKFVTTASGTRYYTSETKFVAGTWYDIGEDTYYFKKTTGYMVTGIVSVSSIYYDFGTDGKCQGKYTGLMGSGSSMRLINDGVAATSSWYKDSEGNRYYFKKDGTANTGLAYMSNEGRYYSFASDGKLIIRNGLSVDSDGKTRLYRDNIAQSGWQNIDGNTYYFSITLGANYGAMVTGNATINSTPYVFDSNGVLQTNTVGFNTDSTGVRYYKTVNDYAKGWYKVENSWYFFSTVSGYMYTGEKTISGYKFTFGTDGKLLSADGKSEGTLEFVTIQEGRQLKVNGKVLTGWQTVNGIRYYTGTKTLVMNVGNKTVGGVAYTFKADGALDVPADGFYTAKDGTMYYNNGEFVTGWLNVDGAMYYFNKKGYMLVDNATISYKYYEFDASGICIGLKNGFVIDGTGTHYYEKGVLKAKSKESTGDSGWLTLYGEKRYFNTSGVMNTGVCALKGLYYDLGTDGISKGLVNGFVTVDSNTLYCVEGKALEYWNKIGENWYYFAKTTGYMVTGSKSVGGYTMDFGTDGKLNGSVEFAEISGKRYITAAGNRLSGWIFINGNAYYCKTSDKTMLYNTTTTVQNVSRTFDENGVCTNYN